MTTSEARVFLDSSLILYIYSDDAAKAARAVEVLRDPRLERVISTQIIGEVAHVARRKAKRSWPDIQRFAQSLKRACAVETVLDEDLGRAFDIAAATGYSWWDSQMIATAHRAGATFLYTEDLQHGRQIGAMTIRNPFDR
jgi:predicted nucleic acid-binding protein